MKRAFRILSLLFLLVVSTTLACEDDEDYTFGSLTSSENTTITLTCAWITEKEDTIEARRDEWCKEIVDGKVVQEMCPVACSNCTPAPSPESTTSKSQAPSIRSAKPSKLSTTIPSIVASESSSCCSFDDGKTCVIGELCNTNKTTCEVTCNPGKWVLKSAPTPGPTRISSTVPTRISSIVPSAKSSCCSFDGGRSCGEGEYCNKSKTDCEINCTPGVWIMEIAPTIAPTHVLSSVPSLTPFCCSFDGGTSCGLGEFCNTSKENCQDECAPGIWVMEVTPTSAPTHALSSAPSSTQSCCSFDGGNSCGKGAFCNTNKTTCEDECAPGTWTKKVTVPLAPTPTMSALPSSTPSCCSVDGGKSCAKGEYCHGSKAICEGVSGCAGKWIVENRLSAKPSVTPSSLRSVIPSTSVSPSNTPSASPVYIPSSAPSTMPSTTPSCCSFDGGQTCGAGEYCNMSKRNCEGELGCAGEWIKEIKPTPAPTLVFSTAPSTTPSCCSFDGGESCGGGQFCNINKENCESGCIPGKWVIEIIPTTSPTVQHSAVPSAAPACCSFDGGMSCGGGRYCNMSKANCENECIPGEWVVEPTDAPSIVLSTMPSEAPSCCSFDGGFNCGGGDFCNMSEANCETDCIPGQWVVEKRPTPAPSPTPSAKPSLPPSCCSFDIGKSCGEGIYCNKSQMNCEVRCAGDWIIEPHPTSAPTVESSVMPSVSSACCSFDGGSSCAVGAFCNNSKTNCLTGCAPGKWIEKTRESARPSPVPMNPDISTNAIPTSCCSWNRGKSCGEGEWCNASKKNCEEQCLADWVPIEPHQRGCCSWDGGESCGVGSWCNQSQGVCEKKCDGKWYFK